MTGEPYHFIITSHMPLPVTVFMVPWLELPMGMVSLFLIDVLPTGLIDSLGTSVTLPPNLRFKLAFTSKVKKKIILKKKNSDIKDFHTSKVLSIEDK